MFLLYIFTEIKNPRYLKNYEVLILDGTDYR